MYKTKMTMYKTNMCKTNMYITNSRHIIITNQENETNQQTCNSREITLIVI
eukprot:Pgem_evm1s18027